MRHTTTEFVLHDGEDEELTTALHSFMQLAKESRLVDDWEGHDSGITIVISVSVGDTIVLSEDGSTIGVRRKR